MRPRILRIGAAALAAALGLAPAAPAGAAGAATEKVQPQKVQKEGLSIELEVAPLEGSLEGRPLREGEYARVRLTIHDALSGMPVSGLYPGAWMDWLRPAFAARSGASGTAAPGATASGPEDCQKKVESFVGGSLLSKPELDLNVYYVLALNQDATISVVDPLFGFGGSKLLALVFLKSPGEDWALSGDGGRLFVSLPESDRVAVVETATWKVVTEVETGPKPRRVVLQPDGQYLWTAHDAGVSAIDARSLRKIAEIPTGRGGHDLAVSHDSRFAFVTNEADGTVSVIDVARLARARDVPTGRRPVSVAWSRHARAAYVANAGDGTLSAVDGSRPEPVATIRAEPGIGQVRFAPGERLAFVVNPAKDTVSIVDTASQRVVQTADVEDKPDQVAFSDELAYVRHRGSETVLMIPLKTVGEAGRPVPVVDFPGGEHPPGRMARPTPADGIVQAPGATAVLVANPEDEVIYFYKEGMAAPMGHFRNYGRQPRAVRVVDRSLRESRPGVYETSIQLGRAGGYELALFLDSPRTVHCFPLEVAANPALEARRRPPLAVELLTETTEVAVGEDVSLRFRLTEAGGGAPRTGLKDVRLLTFLSPGIWQQRHWASEVGAGLYEVRFQPPREGIYFVFLEVASEGMPFQKSPSLVLQAKVAPAGAGARTQP